jgi:alkanesulfonate monooxygenase SsuD/methylene tetrahydromethanopterin reductase-like flavin-dependent oxidoreductase (luciferase family)
MDVGVGLWSMRRTASRPRAFPTMYAQLLDDARLAERLGLHSLWLAEHHFWYDGWCPSPIIAAAAVLGATSRLRVGTGVSLIPLLEPEHAAANLDSVTALFGDRLELGVGLGYRDVEFDGLGLRRRDRGPRMDSALDQLLPRWGEAGRQAVRLWIGGFSDAAIRRAGSRGLSLLLPYSTGARQLPAAIERMGDAASAAGQRPGRLGVMRYVWITDGSPGQRRWAEDMIDASIREYSGAWFPLQGHQGFEVPELLGRQLRRVKDAALIGTAGEIAANVHELQDVGADLVVLQITSDGVATDHRGTMELLAEHLAPGFVRAAA